MTDASEHTVKQRGGRPRRLGETTWYALQTGPQKERIAVRQLWSRGIEVFWPHYLAGVRHGTRRGYAFRSWLQPYMFVADGPNFSAGVVNNLIGVSTLLYDGEGLQIVPEKYLWLLKSLAEPDGLIPSSIAKMKPNNMVDIKGDNLINCLRGLRGLRAKVWASGILSTTKRAA